MKLAGVLELGNPADYKLHCAVWNGSTQPLDEFARDPSHKSWEGWNRYKGKKNAFNRTYILSLMRFYPEGKDIWLFGGIYRVLSMKDGCYEIALENLGREYIGKLKISFKLPGMTVRLKLENYIGEMVFTAMLEDCYSGESLAAGAETSLTGAESTVHATPGSLAYELERLRRLHLSGALTDVEYSAAKAVVLKG